MYGFVRLREDEVKRSGGVRWCRLKKGKENRFGDAMSRMVGCSYVRFGAVW